MYLYKQSNGRYRMEGQRLGAAEEPSFWSKLTDTISKGAQAIALKSTEKALQDVSKLQPLKSLAPAPAPAPAAAPSFVMPAGTSDWILPAAIVGGGVLLFTLLRR